MKLTIEIITDENIGTETMRHLLNEADYEVLKTEKEYCFAMTKKVNNDCAPYNPTNRTNN